jgi:hypothetical protein
MHHICQHITSRILSIHKGLHMPWICSWVLQGEVWDVCLNEANNMPQGNWNVGRQGLGAPCMIMPYYISHCLWQQLAKHGTAVLPHSPYSTNLTPSIFHLFQQTDWLKGCYFKNTVEVQQRLSC